MAAAISSGTGAVLLIGMTLIQIIDANAATQ
jgi:hypothetical protein